MIFFKLPFPEERIGGAKGREGVHTRSSRKIPTQEYVVPRSIPTAGAIVKEDL
jgi:hypothetical protein